MSKELTIKSYDLAKPQEVLSMAVFLKDYIVKQNLFTNISGKNYAHVEGWMFAGFITGLNAIVTSTENISNGTEIKWKASVNVYKGEKLMSTGVALCSSKEANKKGFDEYAILSMAQTRAIGKAYRNLIGWVMKLAGYEGAPAEEMHKVGETIVAGAGAPQKPQENVIELLCHGATKSGCPSSTSLTQQENDYSVKMYGKPLCRNCQRVATKKK